VAVHHLELATLGQHLCNEPEQAPIHIVQHEEVQVILIYVVETLDFEVFGLLQPLRLTRAPVQKEFLCFPVLQRRRHGVHQIRELLGLEILFELEKQVHHVLFESNVLLVGV